MGLSQRGAAALTQVYHAPPPPSSPSYPVSAGFGSVFMCVSIFLLMECVTYWLGALYHCRIPHTTSWTALEPPSGIFHPWLILPLSNVNRAYPALCRSGCGRPLLRMSLLPPQWLILCVTVSTTGSAEPTDFFISPVKVQVKTLPEPGD